MEKERDNVFGKLEEKKKIQIETEHRQKVVKRSEEECVRFSKTLSEKYEGGFFVCVSYNHYLYITLLHYPFITSIFLFIFLFLDSKEEMQLLMSEFQSQMEEIRQQVNVRARSLKSLRENEKKEDVRFQNSISSFARLEVKVQKFDEQQTGLGSNTRAIFREVFPSEDAELLGVSGMLSKLGSYQSEREKEVSDAKSDHEKQLAGLRQTQGKALHRQTEMETQSKHLQKDVASKRVTLQNLKSHASSESRVLESIKEIEGSLQGTEAQLDTVRAEFDPEKAEYEKAQIKVEIDEKMGGRKQLEEDFLNLSSQAQQRASLEHSQKALKEKESELAGLIAQHSQSFKEILEVDLGTNSSSNLVGEVGGAVKLLQQGNAENHKNLENVRQKKGEYHGQLKSSKQALDGAAASLDAAIDQIQAVCPDYTAFEQCLETAETDYEEARKELSIKQSAELMYEEFLNFAKRKSSCMICERKFANSDQTHLFEGKMRSLIEDLPQAAEKARQRSEEAQKSLKEIQGLRGAWERSQELEKVEIPEQKARYTAIRDRLKQIKEQQEKMVGKVEEEKGNLEKAQQLQSIGTHIARLRDECARLRRVIEEEEDKIRSFSMDTRTTDEVRAAKERVQQEIDELSVRKSKVQEKCFQHERKIAGIRATQQNLQNKLKNASDELKRVQEHRKKHDELAVVILQMENEIEKLREKLAIENCGLADLGEKMSLQTKAFRERELTLQKKKSALDQKMIPLKSLSTSLSCVNIDKERNALDSMKQDQNEVRNNLDVLRAQIAEQRDLLTEAEKELTNSDSTFKNIENNIKYRELLEALEGDKDALQVFLEDNRDVAREIVRLQKEKREIEEKLNETKGKWDKCKGVRIQLRDDLNVLKNELRHVKFDKVEANYRKKAIEVQVTEMSMKDLEIYHKALDRALVKYHAAKMAEINTTIKELWQSTYKGQDIDSIQIRSEVPASKAGTGKRAYDYRVVMLKGDVEIDMRGRCSAGQKVLASLVIRLALAETFCVNCGILALDEPTTNLDRRNVESFANALVEIVETRRRQKHFQLIIITHDEEFVQLLGRSNNADYYWRVSKASGGSSVLRRHEIADLS